MPACWSCNADAGDGVTCSACGKLQPPRSGDYFAYLGIPRGYHVDVEKLGEIMRDRSRTLRDPQRRAEYLLSLYGLKAGGNDRAGAKLDPDFLMEMMETRESLAEAKAKSDSGRLAKISAGAKSEKDALEKQADAKFSQWEKSPADKKPLEAIVGILDKMRYFEQILAEAEGRVVAH